MDNKYNSKFEKKGKKGTKEQRETDGWEPTRYNVLWPTHHPTIIEDAIQFDNALADDIRVHFEHRVGAQSRRDISVVSNMHNY